VSDRLSAAIRDIMEQPQGEVSEVNFILSSPRREESEANSNVNHPSHYNKGGHRMYRSNALSLWSSKRKRVLRDQCIQILMAI
jgi:hypothetical protein